jgi:hypothetical protein
MMPRSNSWKHASLSSAAASSACPVILTMSGEGLREGVGEAVCVWLSSEETTIGVCSPSEETTMGVELEWIAIFIGLSLRGILSPHVQEAALRRQTEHFARAVPDPAGQGAQGPWIFFTPSVHSMQ